MKKITQFVILSSTLFYSLLESAPFAYVTDYYSGNLFVIDTQTNEYVESFSMPGTAHGSGIVITTDGKYAYVGQPLDPKIYQVDLQTQGSQIINVPNMNFGLALTSNNKSIYVPDWNFFGSDQFSVVNISTIPPSVISYNITPADPQAIAITQNQKKAFIACAFGDVSVIEIETNTEVASFNVGDYILSNIFISSNGKYALINAYNSNTIQKQSLIVVDVNSYDIKIFPLWDFTTSPGGILYGLVSSNQTGKIYMAGPLANQVCVLTPDFEILEYIDVGTFPIGLALTSDGRYLYVVNAYDKTVSVVDTLTNQTIKTILIPGAASLVTIAIQPDHNYLVQEALRSLDPVKFQ